MAERESAHHLFGITPEYTMSLNQEQEMDQIMQWEQLPFLVAQGTEVLENMRMDTHEGEMSLEEKYLEIRNQILTPPFDKDMFIAVFGRNSAAKGGLNMGFSRMMLQDQYLHAELAKNQIQLETGSVLFSTAQEASKLPQTGVLYDSSLEAGQFSPTDYRLISQFQWDFINENILQHPPEGKARVTFVESACPTVYPISIGIPMVVEGIADRGTSVIYNLLADERTRDNTYVFAIKRDERVGDLGVETRSKYNPFASEEEIEEFFTGNMRMVYRDRHGEDHEAKDLDIDEKRCILYMLKKFSASPLAKERADQELDQIEQELADEGFIEAPDDEHYYSKLREILRVNDTHFTIVTNEYMSGMNTYDLSYFYHDNLILRKYPDILTFPPTLKNNK